MRRPTACAAAPPAILGGFNLETNQQQSNSPVPTGDSMMIGKRCFMTAIATAAVLAMLPGASFAAKGEKKQAQSGAKAQSESKESISVAKEIIALPAPTLVEILKDANATVFQKAKACQRLAVIGGKDAIPALAALLPDETLNVYARSGLEGISDPAADAALREAAGKLQGRQLVGVLSSIGQRKDAAAVGLLKGLLLNADKAVASAAAGALGRIGTSEAAGVLKEALGKDSPVKLCIGDGSLACAEGLAAAGKKDEALALYQAVGKASTAKHQQVAALTGQFRVLDEAAAKELLLAQLRSPERAFFNVGLAAARQVPGAQVTAALVGELEKLPADRQACLLLALGDRKDPLPLATLVAASKSQATPVREAAICVLTKVSDPAALAILLEAALGEGDAAEVAKQGLRNLAGDEVHQAVLSKLSGANGKAKVVLFELVGAHGIAAAEPTVRQALADSDKAVRLAALAAIGQLIELKDLELLAARAVDSTDKEELAVAQDALKAAAQRMADREACAAKLAECLKSTPEANQAYLLEVLGKISGKKALETVVASVKVPAMKDAATKVLGDWINADAAPALLEIAKNDTDAKYRIRALRGYIRIGRQLQLPDDARIAMFHTAMATASRDDEKKLSLDILSRVPSAPSLKLAASYAGDKALKNEACDAAVKVADKLLASNPKAVVEAMQIVVEAKVHGKVGPHAEDLLEQAKAAAK
jgi:HEAT repeat protein